MVFLFSFLVLVYNKSPGTPVEGRERGSVPENLVFLTSCKLLIAGYRESREELWMKSGCFELYHFNGLENGVDGEVCDT